MNPGKPRHSRHLYEFGAFRLDPSERVLARQGQRIILPPKAFDTLLILVQHHGRVLSKGELINTLWPDSFVEENNLTQHISALRRTLAQEPGEYIETVPKLGYRFVPEVHEILPADSEVIVSRTTRAHIVVREEEEIEEEESPSDVRNAQAMQVPWFAKPQLTKPKLIAASALLVVLGLTSSYFVLMRSRIPVVVDSKRLARIEGPVAQIFSTDTDLYFEGPRSIMRLPIEGGEWTEVFTPFSAPALEDFSRSRSEFLVLERGGTVERPLWILPVPSGSPRRVGEVKAHSAAWSPDGERIVYANGNDLFLTDRNGDTSQKVSHDVGLAMNLRWSPDGGLIRYSANDRNAGVFALWEVSPNGSVPVRRQRGGADAEGFAGKWSADGKYFFYEQSTGERTDIWALRETRSGVASVLPLDTGMKSIRVTNGPVGFHNPCPTSDAKKLMAVARIEKAELVRYDVTTRSYQPFLNGISADGLVFSRDGAWFAYTSYPERTLWRSRADGSARQQLTFTPTEALLPTWSPDGQTIAFAARLPGKTWQIYTIPAEGGNPHPLAPTNDDQVNPTWSHDGRLLAFAGAPWLKGWETGSTVIHVVDLHTSELRTLPGSEGLWSPRWSPDGRWLVAETLDSKRLLLYSFESGKWTGLTSADSQDLGYSAWSHDSHYVYFNLSTPDQKPIYRASVNNGRAELLLKPDGVRLNDTLGTWFGLTPDDQPLLLRDHSAQEIYALTLAYR